MAVVNLGEEARNEYREALAWYHARSTLAADGFESAFAAAVERIERNPNQYPPCEEPGFHYISLDRYPFRLIYREVGAIVQVLAVAHARRKPGYWLKRGT